MSRQNLLPASAPSSGPQSGLSSAFLRNAGAMELPDWDQNRRGEEAWKARVPGVTTAAADPPSTATADSRGDSSILSIVAAKPPAHSATRTIQRKRFCHFALAVGILIPRLAGAQSYFEPFPVVRIFQSNQTAILEWRGGLAPYRIQTRSDLDLDWKELPGTVAGNAFSIPLTESSKFFRVSSAVDIRAPTIPGGLTGRQIGCGQLELTWNLSIDNAAGSGLSSYRLYRDGQNIGQALAPSTSWIDSNVDPQTQYAYALSAVDRAGNESAPSLQFKIRTWDDCTNQVSRSVTLAWDPSYDPAVAGYRLYHGTQSRSYPWSTDVTQGTIATATNLQPGVTYYFAVTAYTSYGLESDFSDEVNYTVP